MNEETTETPETPVTNTTDAQSTETETEQKIVATPQNGVNQENTEQKIVAKTEDGGKSEQSAPTTTEDKPAVDTPVTPPDKTAEPTPKDQAQTDTSKPATQDKPAETKLADTQPTTPAEPKTDPATPVKPDPIPATPEQPKKLADVVPTTLVWISGMVGSHQIDCAGPIELPFALTKPEWPYTIIAPNPSYTNQVFDYDAGAWVATDAKSQGQQLTDLNKKVEALQEDSASHDKSADQTQQMGAQLMQTMLKVTNKLTTVENKLDTLLKDGDK